MENWRSYCIANVCFIRVANRNYVFECCWEITYFSPKFNIFILITFQLKNLFKSYKKCSFYLQKVKQARSGISNPGCSDERITWCMLALPPRVVVELWYVACSALIDHRPVVIVKFKVACRSPNIASRTNYDDFLYQEENDIFRGNRFQWRSRVFSIEGGSSCRRCMDALFQSESSFLCWKFSSVSILIRS